MANEDASKLFVAGLPDSITEDVLRRLFEATGGTVVNVSLPKDRATGRPRGFGFVTLSSPDEASSARDALDGSMQAGRPISVRPFSSEPPRRDIRSGEGPGPGAPPPSSGSSGPGEDRTLYVGNLPYDVSQQELETIFSQNGAGPVARIHLPIGPDGRPRGFGFVTLQTAEAANSAIVALRAVEVRGRRLIINIANPRGASPGGGPGGGGPRPMSGGMARPPREGGFEPRPPDRFEGQPVVREGGGGGGGGGEEGGASGGEEGRRARAPAGVKKKKEKAKGRGTKQTIEEERRRGGGGSWQKWADWDDD